jgi:hypothetical protein
MSSRPGAEKPGDPVERWGRFEVSLEGPAGGNPFTEISLQATFRRAGRSFTVDGFYDGTGRWKVRCMPDHPGAWEWSTASNAPALDGRSGRFTCTPARPGTHGPVGAAWTWHFRFADGTPFGPMGTTCYAWQHQPEDLEERTLRALRDSPFNKLRMCVFPKHYVFNANEPQRHPFEPLPGGGWDFTRFNPEFFRHLERRVDDLGNLGIEADLILFHPYDRWGYASMGAANDDRYVRYLVARLASFLNVWWSLANEYDLVEGKTVEDWDRLFRLVEACDPYAHPRSIHNCRPFYDHAKPWVTHASIQHGDLSRVTEWRQAYAKPVVVDECCYEGNIDRAWGNLTPQEMSHRVWEGTARGGWVGHGETYLDPDDVLWWSKGGGLRGESPARIGFLRRILAEAPPWLEYTDRFGRHYPALHHDERYFLVYLGNRQPARMELPLPDGHSYLVEVIDTWAMTIEELPGRFRGTAVIPLPGRPYQALRLHGTRT